MAREVILTRVSLRVGKQPDDIRILQIVEENGDVTSIPMSGAEARKLGGELGAGILVAPGPLADAKRVH